jgi:hypothetical protein
MQREGLFIDSVGKYPICLAQIVSYNSRQPKVKMERTARILTRKKDAIQHKMVMFAWWRKTKRNILIKPSLRCSLKPIWILEAANNSCAPLLVLQNTT